MEWLAGWLGQPIDAPLVQVITGTTGIVMTVLKAYLLVFVAILLRWSTPRVRIDQLLDLGWKFLLPLALVNLLVTAALKLAFPVAFGGDPLDRFSVSSWGGLRLLFFHSPSPCSVSSNRSVTTPEMRSMRRAISPRVFRSPSIT